VVEAGRKTVIRGRCKQPGMFWSASGAENILALRCIHSSPRREDFPKYRLNPHAARNAPPANRGILAGFCPTPQEVLTG
jgi:hypothetical protein